MSQLKSVSVRYDDEFETCGYNDDLFEDPELFSLLEQVLSEVFNVDSFEDEESFNTIVGNSIYFLDSEKEILQIENNQRISLNEGSSDIDSLDELLKEAEDYFRHPNYHSCEESDSQREFLTGFVQIYSGVTYNANGEIIPKWKSIACKIEVDFNEIFKPEILVKRIEDLGIKWTDLIRVMLYGPSLEKVIGSRHYNENDAKELVPLSDEYQNILLAIPKLENDLNISDSIFEFIESEINEGISYGIIPAFGRVALGHHEWTHIRLSELEDEEMEERNLKVIERKEKLNVKAMNDFINKYKDAKDFIRGMNEKVIDVIEVYSLSQEMLENILFVCEKLNYRLKDSALYYQVKAIYSKNKVVSISTQATQAFLIIGKINKGEHVDFHLISLPILEDIFAILWSGVGIKIDSSKKEHYFTLKDSLLRLRASAARKS